MKSPWGIQRCWGELRFPMSCAPFQVCYWHLTDPVLQGITVSNWTLPTSLSSFVPPWLCPQSHEAELLAGAIPSSTAISSATSSLLLCQCPPRDHFFQLCQSNESLSHMLFPKAVAALVLWACTSADSSAAVVALGHGAE